MSSATNPDNKQDDFWDQADNARIHTNKPIQVLRRKAEPVKDDWEDDEDDEEVDDEALWREANSKAPMPEVILARPSTTSASGTVVPPNEALQTPIRILKRPKPSSGTSQSSTGSASSLQKTLEVREAAYQAARERIFGPASKSSDSVTTSGSKPGTPSPLEDKKLEDISEGVAKLEMAPQSQRQAKDNKDKSSSRIGGSRSTVSDSIGKSSVTGQGGVSVIRNPLGPSSPSNTSGSPMASRGFGGRRGGKRRSGSKDLGAAQGLPVPAPAIPGSSD